MPYSSGRLVIRFYGVGGRYLDFTWWRWSDSSSFP